MTTQSSTQSSKTTISTPPLPPPPKKYHVLITGASSGLGRAFFEHFSAFPPTTHHIRGVDARPYPNHPNVSSCTVGTSGHYNQLDLSAEALVQKFVRSATTTNASITCTTSPTISYRQPHHHNQSQTPTTPPPPTTTATSSSYTPSTPRSASNADPPPQHIGPFDLVIHSAGIRGLVPSHEAQDPSDVAGAETIAAMDAATMRRAFEINTLAAFTLIKALLPSLRENPSRPRVVVMASRMGSVASNAAGGAYAYRASKAALNAVLRSFSIDVPEVAFALVHPGRVETGLVRTREEGAIEVGESVGDMLGLIERLGQEEGNRGLKSGCFVDRWGKEIPW
ncbi:Glucose/ribitol dehydrogenase [Botryosphaeria dothidea]|uniref:Glucose/ribitol dehydrogenase n=1 Tax=Botryosphaeria dothidea TaxID=55169 RepID=A0A8H4NAQ6_9PEZI|nr:Glucose/ribitol dehydrogenase [Botryosphaeria dothidea]